MTHARISSGIAFVVALASCSHQGASVAPSPAPVPASLDVAVTDATDSIVGWLSGAYQLSARSGDTVRLEPLAMNPGPVLIVHRVEARDARDAIDAGVDALLTDDPDAIAYAATRADLTSVPSGWNRAYGLLVRAGDQSTDGEPASALDILRTELAIGAVRVEARPARMASDGACTDSGGATTATTGGAAPGPRIVYSRTDDVARALAARLVALGASRRELLAALSPSLVRAGSSLRAEGVDAGEAARQVARGSALAAVVAVPRVPDCSAGAVPGMNPGLTRLIPLIETRERLIAKRRLTGGALAALARAIGDSAQAAP